MKGREGRDKWKGKNIGRERRKGRERVIEREVRECRKEKEE